MIDLNPFQPFHEKLAIQRIEAAEALADDMRKQRDAALAEVEKIKRDVRWTMDHLRISDIIRASESVPASEPGYTPPTACQADDSDRIEWINANGRVALGTGRFVISIPTPGNVQDEALPTPYNIRDIVDICRGLRGDELCPEKGNPPAAATPL